MLVTVSPGTRPRDACAVADMLNRFSIGYREAVGRIGARGQHIRIKTEGYTRQHSHEVRTRGTERRAFLFRAHEPLHTGQPCNRENRENESPWAHAKADCEMRQEAKGGERNHNREGSDEPPQL